MMPVLGRGCRGARHSRRKDQGRRLGWRQPQMVTSTGFTLVEMVVSSSILALALASSFRGWSQGQALVQQANQRQVLLNAIAQDLQRQQGLVIQKLKTTVPWACDMPLAELKAELENLPHDLPEVVERQWRIQSQPPALVIHYTTPNLKQRKRWLALGGGGSACA